MVWEMLFPKKKPLFSTLQVRKSIQAQVRLLAIAQGVTVQHMTEELLREGIAKRRTLVLNVATQMEQQEPTANTYKSSSTKTYSPS